MMGKFSLLFYALKDFQKLKILLVTFMVTPGLVQMQEFVFIMEKHFVQLLKMMD